MKSVFRKLRTGSRLGGGFGLVLLLVLAMAGYTALRLLAIADSDARIEALTVQLDLVRNWRASTQVNLNRAMAQAKAGYPASLDNHFRPLIEETSKSISSIQRDVKAGLATEEARTLFESIEFARADYLKIRRGVTDRFKAGDAESGARLVDGEMTTAVGAYLDALARMEAHYVSQRVAVRQEALNEAGLALQTLAVATALALAVGATVAWLLSRSIAGPLVQATKAARRIAEGDLLQQITQDAREDEIGSLQAALAQMQDNLQRMVAQIRQGTDSIAIASAEISVGSADLSARTETAASSLQQTAASVEEVTSAVSQTASAARMAHDMANAAAGAAERGGAVTGDAVRTIGELDRSAKRIADIVGIIDAIAFQTNILALNAAVEAARAGDSGRGFAVVASEVRGLAKRSAEAAAEIRALIQESMGNVQASVHLVGLAGATMSEVVDSVQRVTGVIAKISVAAEQQSKGIDQVNVTVAQLEEATQQNAALAEQSAAAAESMRAQASGLARAASGFRIAQAAQAAALLTVQR